MEWRDDREASTGSCLSGEVSWSEAEFQRVGFGDKRPEQRVKRLAEDLGARPLAPINQASADWAAPKAAYRFFANPKASGQKIFAAHRDCTVQRRQGQAVAVAIQDAPYLNYSHHPQTKGLGPLGDSRSAAQGLVMHSTLVVTPAGLPLGLLTQEIWARAGYKPQSARERKDTAIEAKESYRWITARQETVETSPPSTLLVTLCDREADIYEFLVEADRLDAKFVLRAAWDRHSEHDNYPRLWPLGESQAVAGYVTAELPPREKREPRQARLALRFTTVTLDPPQRHRSAVAEPLSPLSVYAVHVQEVEPPAEGPALGWMLVTNIPVPTVGDALPRVEW